MAQIGPHLFVGTEARDLRSCDGLGLDGFAGHGFFIGPTVYAKPSERLDIARLECLGRRSVGGRSPPIDSQEFRAASGNDEVRRLLLNGVRRHPRSSLPPLGNHDRLLRARANAARMGSTWRFLGFKKGSKRLRRVDDQRHIRPTRHHPGRDGSEQHHRHASRAVRTRYLRTNITFRDGGFAKPQRTFKRAACSKGPSRNVIAQCPEHASLSSCSGRR
jgi:hypothetical protein